MLEKEKKPLVSVIIPTYNRRDYVQEAIESVLNQTYQIFELFVIDDGSTDGTDEIIRNKYDGKLTYIWQHNQGESAARNLGISLSSGKYLAFLDSDDKWEPKKLEVIIPAIEKRREEHDEIVLICSSVWMIDDEGKLIQTQPAGRSKNLEKKSFLDFFYRPRIYAPPSNAVFVKKYVEEVGGFDEDIQYGEDWALLIKLRENYKFIYIDTPLTYFRVHKNNQQSFSKLENINQYLVEHLAVVERSSHLIENPSVLRKIKAHFYEQTAYWFFYYNSWESGLGNLNKAISFDRDGVLDGNRVIQNIAISGLENAKYNGKNSVFEIIEYFTEKFLPKIRSLWPTTFFFQSGINRKTAATFCHILMCDKNIQKSRKGFLRLSFSSLRRFRYWRSITTWKTILRNFLLPGSSST